MVFYCCCDKLLATLGLKQQKNVLPHILNVRSPAWISLTKITMCIGYFLYCRFCGENLLLDACRLAKFRVWQAGRTRSCFLVELARNSSQFPTCPCSTLSLKLLKSNPSHASGYLACYMTSCSLMDYSVTLTCY